MPNLAPTRRHAAAPRLIGVDGRPLRGEDLTRPLAAPSRGGLRRSWRAESVASALTPERLAGLIRSANQGDADAQLTLAEEMEERDLHYAAVLGVRKRAVARLPIEVEAASEDAADQALAKEVEALAKAPGLRSGLFHLLDGLGKGYAAVETNWDTSRTPWMPRDRLGPTGRRVRGYAWRDPRHFRYDLETGFELRLIDEADPVEGLALAPYRFIVHEPEIKSGLPIRNGLARLAVVAYMAKSFSLRDWLAFAELFGLPLRLGKWGTGASEEDIATLIDAVVGLGTDGAGAIPASMSVEFVESKAGSAGGETVFERLATWWDKQVSKGVLGQVGTTEGEAGRLGGLSEMGDVRTDIRDADAEQLSDTLAFDLVAPFLALNHGAIPAAELPRLLIRAPDRPDAKLLADVAAALIPLGVRVDAQGLRALTGLPDPSTAPGAETLGTAPAAAVAPNAAPTAAGAPALQQQHGACTCGACTERQDLALNRAAPARPDPQVVLDALADGPLAQWRPQLAPLIEPVLDLADEVAGLGLPAAEAYAEFVRRLEDLAGDLDAVALIDSLAGALFRARGYGDATDA